MIVTPGEPSGWSVGRSRRVVSRPLAGDPRPIPMESVALDRGIGCPEAARSGAARAVTGPSKGLALSFAYVNILSEVAIMLGSRLLLTYPRMRMVGSRTRLDRIYRILSGAPEGFASKIALYMQL